MDLQLPIILTHHHHHWHLPPGSIMAFAGNIVPDGGTPVAGETFLETYGWMACDGRLLLISQHPHLYAAIGTLYNQTGDDANYFRLPDYRGYFLRMVDGGRGIDKDASTTRTLTNGAANTGVGSIQEYAVEYHQHEYTELSVVPPSLPPPAPTAQGGSAVAIPEGFSALTSQPTNSTTTPPGQTGNVNISEYETRPYNMYVYYIIKF